MGFPSDETLSRQVVDDGDDGARVDAQHLRAAAIRFREQGEGGRIIVVGSPAGQRGNFGQTTYAAAKAGIVGFVRTWAMELQRANVTVNALIPVAATAMTETIPAPKPYVDA